MKKLLVVAQSLGGGGTEIALIEFLNHLDSTHYDITLLLIDNNDEYEYRLKQNVKIKYIKFDNIFYKKLASMNFIEGKAVKKLKINSYVDIYKLIAAHASKPSENFDIGIDFYGYGSFTTAYLALNVNAKRKAFWLHDQRMPWIANVSRYFKYYDTIFGVSKAIINSFNSLYPAKEIKTESLYNVIDTAEVIRKSKEFLPQEFSDNVFNIVTVGRLTEQKGYDIAIEAASKLRRKSIPFVWYVIGDGRDRKKLSRLVEDKNLRNQFILLGRKDNPYPYIKNCDLYVQPSRHEGYGLAVLEARTLKKPIVVSDLPSLKEQIKDRENGIVSKLNPNELAKNIEEMYFNKLLRIKCASSSNKVNFDDEIKKFDQFSNS